jgi:anti-anti-sigma factor
MTSTLSRPVRAVAPPEPSDLLLSIDLARGLISVRGELDRGHAHRLDDAVDVLRGCSAEQWWIDVSGITFCDAGGLRSLLRAHRTALRAGRRLVIAQPGRMLARLLALVGADELDVVAGERWGGRDRGSAAVVTATPADEAPPGGPSRRENRRTPPPAGATHPD